MKDQEEQLVTRLKMTIECFYTDWQVSGIEIVGRGLEALVCYAYSKKLGPVAIKVPWTRWITNANDAALDARALLQQEALLASHLRSWSIPTPVIHILHLGEDDFDFLVSTYVDQDQSAPDRRTLGQVIRSIHECPVLDLPLVAQKHSSLHTLIAERLVHRTKTVEQLAGIQLPLPQLSCLQALMDCPEAKRCLLHMDARPENFMTREGQIIAVIDWSNALIGDPALELARIAEYGYLNAEFLTGYGDLDCFARLPRHVELLYRLDTAVMLAVVFLSEAPEPYRAVRQVRRVIELYTQLEEEIMKPE